MIFIRNEQNSWRKMKIRNILFFFFFLLVRQSTCFISKWLWIQTKPLWMAAFWNDLFWLCWRLNNLIIRHRDSSSILQPLMPNAHGEAMVLPLPIYRIPTTGQTRRQPELYTQRETWAALQRQGEAPQTLASCRLTGQGEASWERAPALANGLNSSLKYSFTYFAPLNGPRGFFQLAHNA